MVQLNVAAISPIMVVQACVRAIFDSPPTRRFDLDVTLGVGGYGFSPGTLRRFAERVLACAAEKLHVDTPGLDANWPSDDTLGATLGDLIVSLAGRF